MPREVKKARQQSLAIRWIDNSRKKKGKPMHLRLAEELVDTFNGTGASVTWKENIHKMAEANKAYARTRALIARAIAPTTLEGWNPRAGCGPPRVPRRRRWSARRAPRGPAREGARAAGGGSIPVPALRGGCSGRRSNTLGRTANRLPS